MTINVKKRNVLVLCANYYKEDVTINFIHEILSQHESDMVNIILIDNSHKNTHAKKLAEINKSEPRVKVLYPPDNIGYMGAARYGLKEYMRQHETPEWVIVSNTDISFPDKDFFKNLFMLYPEGGSPAVIAPSIISSLTKSDQNPQIIKRPKKIRMLFYTYVFKYYSIFQIYSFISFLKEKVKGNLLKHNLQKNKIKEIDIYAPHGSFFILNKNYFNKGGNLEHGVLMFGETITIAENAKSHNMKVLYEPRLNVIHNEHSTTGRIKSRKIVHYQWEAAKYTYNAYFGN